MSVAWLAPAALVGATLVLLPIAVHLLVRQHARVQVFPSLRFLRETQLAALRRRRIEDAALLMCRAAIVVAAIVALAGPLVMTSARTAGFARRISRAVILADETSPAVAATVADGTFRSMTIKRAAIADAIADATRWFEQQPASSREIVVIGRLPRDAVTTADLAAIPQGIGVRFVRSGSTASADMTIPILTRRNGVLTRIDRLTHLSSDGTQVTNGGAVAVPNDLVTIAASATDSRLAEAALRVALDAGIPWRDYERHVLIVWDGADETQTTRGSSDMRVIRMPRPAPDAATADAVRDVLAQASRPTVADSVAITDQQLADWSRPAGPPAADAQRGDEGDRRWVWAIGLVLLALEWRLRERRNAPLDAASEDSTEVRVA